MFLIDDTSDKSVFRIQGQGINERFVAMQQQYFKYFCTKIWPDIHLYGDPVYLLQQFP